MKIKLIGLVVILTAAAGVWFFYNRSLNPQTVMPQKNSEKEDVAIAQRTRDAGTAGKATTGYLQFDDTVLNMSKGSRRVLFFYAHWCPTCRAANESFEKNINAIPEDVVVIRVNYNDSDTDENEKSLAKKYGIGYQHTFVEIDAAGNQVNLWNGGEFEELLKNLGSK